MPNMVGGEQTWEATSEGQRASMGTLLRKASRFGSD